MVVWQIYLVRSWGKFDLRGDTRAFRSCVSYHSRVLALGQLPPRYDLPWTMPSIPTGNGLSCLLSGGLPVL